MMKQYEVLQWAFSFLDKYGRERSSAERLLEHLLDLDRAQLYQQMHTKLSPTLIAQFKQAIKEHATTGRPIQHMIGIAYFYGREFIVNPDVLIPRFETEELVSAVMDAMNEQMLPPVKTPLNIVDVGTGSGVIAITLALELATEKIKLYGVDISETALATAQKNAQKHAVDITWLQGNYLAPSINANIVPD